LQQQEIPPPAAGVRISGDSRSKRREGSIAKTLATLDNSQEDTLVQFCPAVAAVFLSFLTASD
jgi:hypothetical protein